VTLEQALELIAERASRTGGGKKAPARATPAKKAAKKAPAKKKAAKAKKTVEA